MLESYKMVSSETFKKIGREYYGGRALCFFWSNPILIKELGQFFNYLDKEFLINFFIITNNYSGKLLFLKEGIQAFTLGELLDMAPHGTSLRVPDADIEGLLQYDLEIGHLRVDDYGGKKGLFNYARGVLNAYSLLAQKLSPQIAFVWNGAAFWQRAMAYVAKERQVPCFFMERGLLSGTLVVDPKGVNYGSSIAGRHWKRCRATEPSGEDVAKLDEFRGKLVLSRKTVVAHGLNLTSEEAQERLKIPPEAIVVLLPLQIESDSNILFYSPFYKSMPAVIGDVVEALECYPDVYLVVKPHPEDKDRLVELDVFSGSQCQLNDELSLPTLLDCADVVVTINSTVGLEALLFGKPVVTLGQAIYSNKGFTFDMLDRSDLPSQLGKAIASIHEGALEKTSFNVFLIYLLKYHLFSIAEKDVWGSRRNIGLSIVSRIDSENVVEKRSDSPWFDMLTSCNDGLMSVLRGYRDNEKRKILFINTSLPENLIVGLKDTVNVYEYRDISLIRRFKLLCGRRYFMVIVEHKGYGKLGNFLFRIWCFFLRAEHRSKLM